MKKEEWLAYLAHLLNEFSSAEYQERIWLHGLGPQVSSFEEAVCRFFDDFGSDESIRLEWNAFLSEEQVGKLLAFRDALRDFSSCVPEISPPNDILGNPGWFQVRRLAKEALRTLERNG